VNRRATLRLEAVPLLWEPPALAGGAELQFSEKAFDPGMGFSPGFRMPALKRMNNFETFQEH
jgi:hypothetical protein